MHLGFFTSFLKLLSLLLYIFLLSSLPSIVKNLTHAIGDSSLTTLVFWRDLQIALTDNCSKTANLDTAELL